VNEALDKSPMLFFVLEHLRIVQMDQLLIVGEYGLGLEEPGQW